MEENNPEEITLLAERYVESVADLRELRALPLNHERREHELLRHVFPDMMILLQFPDADKFPDYERVQSEMLNQLSLDELKELTEFVCDQFMSSRAVSYLIDRYLDRFPALPEEIRAIRELTQQIKRGEV